MNSACLIWFIPKKPTLARAGEVPRFLPFHGNNGRFWWGERIAERLIWQGVPSRRRRSPTGPKPICSPPQALSLPLPGRSGFLQRVVITAVRLRWPTLTQPPGTPAMADMSLFVTHDTSTSSGIVPPVFSNFTHPRETIAADPQLAGRKPNAAGSDMGGQWHGRLARDRTAGGWLAAERSEAPDRTHRGTAAFCPSHPPEDPKSNCQRTPVLYRDRYIYNCIVFQPRCPVEDLGHCRAPVAEYLLAKATRKEWLLGRICG